MTNINNSVYDVCILIIDNNADFLGKIQKLLKKSGFQNIWTAESMSEAILVCEKKGTPYFIITEYQNEFNNLIENITKLCSNTKFIVLTGSTKIGDAFRSMEKGALSYIHKSEKNWNQILIDSLRTWVEYYRNLETFKEQIEYKLSYAT